MGTQRWTGVGIGAMCVALATGCGQGSGGGDSRDRQAPGGTTKAAVTYYIEGTPRYASVTMETPSGTQQVDADVPLSTATSGAAGLTFQFDLGEFVYVSAQLPGPRGEISCRIEVDGQVISENTSSGGYAVVTCEGSA